MPATHDFAVDFTNTDDIEDTTENEEIEESTEDEDTYDVDSLRGILESLSTNFKNLNQVRPTCNEVETLLLVTGHNSWEEFKAQHKELLNEYWQTQYSSPDVIIDRTILNRAVKRVEMVKTKIVEVEKATKSYKAMMAKLETERSAAEMEALASEGMEWDPDTHERHQKAKQVMGIKANQIMVMAKKSPEGQLKQLYQNLRLAEGQLRYSEGAMQGNVRVLINTGNPKEDARLVQKLADSVVWDINRLYDREMALEDQLSNERYSGADMGVARMTLSPFEDTRGGVGRNLLESLMEVRDQITDHFATYAACCMVYETAAQAFVPKYDNEWFPQFMELSQALTQARQRARTAQINKARNQLEAAREMAKR